jgi:hypothetical protein
MTSTFFVAIVSQTNQPVSIGTVLPTVPGTTLTPAPRPRRKRLDNYELNLAIKKYLDQKPKATNDEIAKAVGVSAGKVNGMEAWRLEMAKRKAAREPSKKPHRQLTDKMLACIGREDDIAARIDAEVAVFQRLIEQASQDERANLHAMTRDERKRLIEATAAQMTEQLAERRVTHSR